MTTESTETSDNDEPVCLGLIEDADLCVHLDRGKAVLLIQSNGEEDEPVDVIILHTREDVQALILLLVETIPFVPLDDDGMCDDCAAKAAAVKAAEELLES